MCWAHKESFPKILKALTRRSSNLEIKKKIKLQTLKAEEFLKCFKKESLKVIYS